MTPEEYIGVEDLFAPRQAHAGNSSQELRHRDGKLDGTKNRNPILDARLYSVMFSDG